MFSKPKSRILKSQSQLKRKAFNPFAFLNAYSELFHNFLERLHSIQKFIPSDSKEAKFALTNSTKGKYSAHK